MVPRKVICFPLRQKDIPEYLVNGVMSLYKSLKLLSQLMGELSSSFSVKVGVHQWFALNPLLFMMVKDVPTRFEGWFTNGVVVCRRFCFVWGIIK